MLKNKAIFAAMLCTGFWAAAPVHASAPRTFVASYGSDTNPCSLASPCRTFAAALAQVNSGGELIVLDSAGYGPITITQSVSVIVPDGIYAGVSVGAGSVGIQVNAPGADVTLRGIAVTGAGGIAGIVMSAGATLSVRNCIIGGFASGGASPQDGAGIYIGTAAQVSIDATVVNHNYLGISVDGGAAVTISNSLAQYNYVGVWVYPSPGNATTRVLVAGSDTSFNHTGVYTNAGSSPTAVDVSGTTANYNSFTGIQASASSNLTASGSTAIGNQYGFDNSGGTFNSAGNNRLDGNTGAPTLGTITLLPSVIAY